jgi:glycosyltransferase involved in cell wall biosynthesis
MNNSKAKISVIIPTCNVESIIARAIKSAEWADEILVVDSFSTDRTVEIAEAMGARVVQHEYVYSAKQKNWIIPQAKHEWIFLLDSDEEVTPELHAEIESLISMKQLDHYDGCAIARPELFLTHWLKWGGRYPLYNIRLFRKSCRYEDRDVHAHIILPKDRVKILKGDLLHYSNPTLDHYFSKFNRYTTYQANYMVKVAAGHREIEWRKFFTHFVYAKSIAKDYWYFLPFVPFLRFFYMYILRAGFMDGRHGFLLAVLYAFQDYVSKTKYLELTGRNPQVRFMAQKFMINNVIPHGNNNKIVDRVNCQLA